MEKEDWERIEKALDRVYGSVEISADATFVEFRKLQISSNRLGIVTFVNGQIDPKWLVEDCPERKYLREESRFVYSPKQRKRIKSLAKSRAGRKELKANAIDLDKKIVLFDAKWPNVKSIRRHYEKTFDKIALVKVNDEIVYGVPHLMEVNG